MAVAWPSSEEKDDREGVCVCASDLRFKLEIEIRHPR